MNETEINNDEQAKKNWTCDFCSNTVPATQDYCNKCGYFRTTEEAPTEVKEDCNESQPTYANDNISFSENTENTLPTYQYSKPQPSQVSAKNKIVIAVVLAVAILIGAFAIYWFAFRGTKLTPENVSDYITVSLSGTLNESYTGEYFTYYDSVDLYGNVKGVSGYEFEDVSIIIDVYVGSMSEEDTVSFVVYLNKDGDAIIDTTRYFGEDRTCILGIQSYDIVSVSGKVVKR